MTVLLRRRLMQASGGGEGDYSKQYLTLEFSSAGSIGISHGSRAPSVTVYYRKNGGAWIEYTLSTMMQVVEGDKIEWKGNNPAYNSYMYTATYANKFSGTAIYQAYGNMMSLIAGDSFKNATTFSADSVFANFFSGTTITNAENLILPVTTLTNNCYRNMFMGCSRLTTAPTLPATAIANYAYNQMFRNCSNLSYIKCLGITTGQESTSNWVSGVASSGTFVKHPNATWGRDTSGIPANWTVQDATS